MNRMIPTKAGEPSKIAGPGLFHSRGRGPSCFHAVLPRSIGSGSLVYDCIKCYHMAMRASHRKTLEAIFARPVRGGIRWAEIEALFRELGAEVTEREGSRIGVFLFGEVRVFHRPHPSPDTDKGAVASVRKWLEANGVEP